MATIRERKQVLIVSNMSFSEALIALKKGHAVQRTGWNGRGMYIEMQMPDPQSKMTRPYLFIHDATNNLVPWLASQTDILEEDWQIVLDI